jgi:tetratricopeptide (TPR) repeat protein
MLPLKNLTTNKHIIAGVVSLIAFAVYLRTLCPTVTFIDSGELCAVAYTLGIAHPTGYPLFTLLGWVFVHLPLGLRPVYQLNLMAALLCAVAVFAFFHFLVFILDQFDPSKINRGEKSAVKRASKSDAREGTSGTKYFAAAVGAFILAFSETFWAQAVSIEVYSLHTLFLSAVLLLFTKAMQAQIDLARDGMSGSRTAGWWFAFAFVLGLSFTNHMTTIMLAPGFLYLYFTVHGFCRPAWRNILMAAIPFMLGLSLYIYLPLRASHSPMLNWGDPSTVGRLLSHLRGKQYSVWLFSSLDTAWNQLKYFVSDLPTEFIYGPLLLMLVGLVRLYRVNRILFVFIVVLFASCVFYAINYEIHDIDSYFLLAYFMAAVWSAFGARSLLENLKDPVRLRVGAAVCGAIALMPLVGNFTANDQSEDFAVEDYTVNMFNSFESNALVLSYQWDYWVSASYYYQLVEGYRPDVAVIDKELLRRSWYFKKIEHRYPWLIQNSRREVEEFLAELYKFEHSLPYDPAAIQARYEAMILSFLQKAHATRPVYVTNEIEPEFFRGFQRVPAGLAFRLYRDTLAHEISPKEVSFRPISKVDKLSQMVVTFYAAGYTNQAAYLGILGRREEALPLLRRALVIRPGFQQALVWIDHLGGR